ncbi:MAG: WYL domain-containing transcriptional regulator [Cyclobacteriaceae bacterium]|nr:WYL domain-containing transcriptional regulator [Cyclobacteriaceae bacterium]
MKKTNSEDDSIIPQAKMLRVFRLIALLKSGHWTIAQLASRLDMNRRSIYRYLHLLEAIDFNVDKDFQDRYFIFTSEEESANTQFTIDEMNVLKQLVKSEISRNALKASLLKKLSLNSEMDTMPALIIKARNGKMVELLSGAIKNKKQVILSSYHSANSSDVRDRLIEPIAFGDDYQTVLALDVKDKSCKQFKLERIGEVVVRTENFQFEKYHEKNTTDIFGMTGSTATMITLKLKMRAYLLLREEFPLAIPYLEKLETGEYQFYGPVKSFEGVGRFVMGLADAIEIVAPGEFKDFVREKLSALRTRK